MAEGRDPGRGSGRDYESSVDPDRRRRDGIHYTPPEVADSLIAIAFGAFVGANDRLPAAVLDPSCGAGSFLVAAADALVAGGVDPEDALARLWGIDTDVDAIAVCRDVLGEWARAHSLDRGVVREVRLEVADGLRTDWTVDGIGPDVIVGNPPFGGQLAGDTVRDDEAAELAERILGRPSGYLDTAGLFLVAAHEAVADEGIVVMIQPLSIVASRDATPVRDAIGADLIDLLLPEIEFDASVHVCVPVIRRRSDDHPSSRGAISWSDLVATTLGVPELPGFDGPTIAAIADSSAGFREEFYVVADAVREADALDGLVLDARPRLITVGAIDPDRLRWGSRPTKVAGASFIRPVVDVIALDDALAASGSLPAWRGLRTRPKVLVATQTRVVEAIVDLDGSLWPSVPVISVLPDDDTDPYLLLAALLSPVASVWAARRAAGTARSRSAMRLTAAQVAAIPLPTDSARWIAAADALADGRFDEAMELMVRAHGLDDTTVARVWNWWGELVRGRRGATG